MKEKCQLLGFVAGAEFTNNGQLFVIYGWDGDYCQLHSSWNPLEVFEVPADELYEHRNEFQKYEG